MTDPRGADIIILSLNRVEDTVGAIASALEQEGIAKRIWVVDQASNSAQHERLTEFVRGKPVVLKSLPQNEGVPAGRNIASRMGSAPYIVALDNDAVFSSPRMLQRAIGHLEADPALGAIGFRILNFFSHKDDVSSWGYRQPIEQHANKEFFVAQFVGAGHAMRRAAFEASGGYDDSLFFTWEEMDLSYRMLNAGYKVKYVPDVVVLHKLSPEARIAWNNGRYYYTVRNRLYVHCKYGATVSTFARTAAGYLIRGTCNGVLWQALVGMIDAVRLYRRFARTNSDRAIYVLRPDVQDYIRECNLDCQGRNWEKLRTSAFTKLPKQGDGAN